MGRRKRPRKSEGLPSPPFTSHEISLLLKALSLFEHAFRHDASEKHAISALKRKLHEELIKAR